MTTTVESLNAKLTDLELVAPASRYWDAQGSPHDEEGERTIYLRYTDEAEDDDRGGRPIGVMREDAAVTAEKLRAAAPALVAGVRAVLTLHVRHESTGKCAGCWHSNLMMMHVPEWPCTTLRALGVES